MDDAVKSTFTPEFRNRLTSVVKFNAMTPEMAKKIAVKQLNILSNKLVAKKVKFKYNDAVVDAIVNKAQAVDMGGREIIRVVDKQIKPLFVNEILFGTLASGGSASLSAKDGEFSVNCTAKKTRTKKAEAVTV
jgi:ATP-dependent Clp protease ATP-binding subunit ClpA